MWKLFRATPGGARRCQATISDLSTVLLNPARIDRLVSYLFSHTPNNRTSMSTHPTSAPGPDDRRVRLRRSPKLIAVGFLLAALGGLLAAVLVHQSSNQQAVLVMTRTVMRGEVIGADDLTRTTVGSARGVETVSADRLSEVVGQRARVDLPRGALFGATSVGDIAGQPGEDIVGVKLASGRLPTGDLRSGDRVLLVPVGDAAGDSIEARVCSMPRVIEQTTETLLDLSVTAGKAEQVARLAALDQLALVKRGPA